MLKKKFPSLTSIGSDGNTAFLRAARAGNLEKVLEQLKNNVDINTSNANGLNALHLASKDGHTNVVSELLKRGAKVDSATKKGNTALHIASLAGQEEVVQLLVEHGACVNVQSQNGFTPLYMAAQENHDAVVRFLLASGANQSLATEDGFTPLAVAMQQGHNKVVAVLLENDTRGKVRLPALHIAAKKDDCKAAALLLQNEHNPDVTSKSGFTPLHIASHYGNEGIAVLLLSKGADVNYAAKHNITPLHVAAKWGKANMVSVLLSKGANIEAKTRDGLTPLHCAARSGHEQVVDMLLERGAPISAKTKNGLAALHMAAQGDHVDAARILLYHRAPVDDVTVDYLTALHVAAHCGHVGVARLLLDRKADPNARALNGFTPLHIACKKNRIKVVELLLKHGASIEATTESGLTPLHVASFMGCMNIVIYLVQNEASPDVKTVRGETPLHLAARANQTDIIRILLRNGAQVDARAREQQTPLHIASRLGNVDIVMLLLQHGANVDSTTKDLYTALHIAAKEGQEEVASVLLENGASLESTTKKGFTPLHLAAKYGHMNVAKLFLRRDAPADAQGKNGVTPLHVASHYDHQNVALLLLEKGASPHATAKNGHTPLHIAARKNQMDIATTLLEYGAKASAESKAGFTPLHLSAQEGHTDMSNLLIEHQADINHRAKNGLAPLHLCSQEDRVDVAKALIKNNADVNITTKAEYTPLHVACHFGQIGMVRLLLANGASVTPTTAVNYTPLHQAAQQGHSAIVNELMAAGADANATTNQGQTPLAIAQKLGYISVVEALKGVTDAPISPTSTDEKYKVVAPETMQETFMSDSEDEGGEDTMLSEQPYHYLTVDEMRGLGDDSLPIDVTRDERDNRDIGPPTAIDDTVSPQHMKESYTSFTATDNVDITRHPQHIGKLQWKNFLVSFLVDARGGAMRGCRHSGVRVIVPPRRAPMPLRVTCRYLKRDKLPHPPPLMEGEALASRILELGPVGAKFLGPVMIEVPHFGSLRGKEREIVILRSDNGETWREHTFEASEEAIHDVLSHSFDNEEMGLTEDGARTTRILTTEFPHYIAVVSRVRQEVHAIGPEGGMVSSTVVPQVQAVFPHGALTKKIKVGLQAQPIPAELTAKLLGNRVAVSPIVTVEPRRRKFHKPISLTIPVPQAANKGMINQYSGDAPTLRLLCSITGGTTRAQWEDVTGSTPLTFVNDCVSFTTTVSARFWLMDCRNISEATKMATELYREAIHVPFMAKFVVFAKRVDTAEARLRVFCMTDDKEDKTLEHQEHFTEVAKSRDVEVLEGKMQYLEFAGNLVPVTKSGDQLHLGFRAFKENRLPFIVRVKDPHADSIGRIIFMREPKVAKGDVPQQPACILNIVLPEEIVPEADLPDHDMHKHSYITHTSGLQRLSDISNLLGEDWGRLAGELGVSPSDVNNIKTELCESSVAHQGLAMMRLWLQDAGNKASAAALEEGLRNIGRDDIIQQTIFNIDQSSPYALSEELSPSYTTKHQFKRPSVDREILAEIKIQERTIKKDIWKEKDDKDEKKYEAEEKAIDEDSLKSVTERKKEIEKRLSEEKDPAKSAKTKQQPQSAKDSKPPTGKPPTNGKQKKLLDDTTEKEIAEEKAVSPEPAHMPFDEKRKSFEMGITPKEMIIKQESTQMFLNEERRSVKDDVKELMTEKMDEKEVEEEQLTFQEKRKSFEQGGISFQKSGEKTEEKKKKDDVADEKAVDRKRDSDFRRDSQLFEEVSEGLGRIDIGSYKTHDLLSPSVVKTPPPSPAEFNKESSDNKRWSGIESKLSQNQEERQPKLEKAGSTGSSKERKGSHTLEPEDKGETQPVPQPRVPIKPLPRQETTPKPDTETEQTTYATKKSFWEQMSTGSTEEIVQTPPVPKPRTSLSHIDVPPSIIKQGTAYSKASPVNEASDLGKTVSQAHGDATTQEVARAITQERSFSQDGDTTSELEYIRSHDLEELSYDNDAFDDDKSLSFPKRPMYERSISLPVDSASDATVRVKKRIFEEQIKKEMVVEQLMSQLDEEGSPERKSLKNKCQAPPKLQPQVMVARQIHSDIFTHELDEQIDPNQPEDKAIRREITVKTETTPGVVQVQREISKLSDSLEVHVDKSELEDTEKVREVEEELRFLSETDAKTKPVDKSKVGSITSSQGESEDTFSESDVTPEETRFKEQSDVQDWTASVSEKDRLHPDRSEDYKKSRSVHTPEEHIPDTVWEVPVQEESISVVEELVQSIKPVTIGESQVSDKKKEARAIAETVISGIERELSLTDLKLEAEDKPEEKIVEPTSLAKDSLKFTRRDTTTSSMEITDEDLRSSGVDTDNSPMDSLVGQQILPDEHSMADVSEEFELIEQDRDFGKDVLDKTLAEVKESLEAVKEELIEDKKKKKVSITKESPSEFEFKALTLENTSETIQEYQHEEISGHLDQKELTVISDSKAAVEDSAKKETKDDVQVKIESGQQEIKMQTEKKEEEKMGSSITQETVAEFEDPTTKIRQMKKETVTENIQKARFETHETYYSHEQDYKQHQTDSKSDDRKSPIEDLFSTSSSSDCRASDPAHTLDKPSVGVRKHKKASSSIKSDGEIYSSSGESHYQSFEQTSDSARSPGSRPLSSDIEGLVVATGSSEYESALSHELSAQSTTATSKDFHTAVSSLSSRDSMKSLDSESSGNLASVEVSSEASETLVPSAMELDRDFDYVQSSGRKSKLECIDGRQKVQSFSESIEQSVSFDMSAEDISEDDDKQAVDLDFSKRMKRSHEMTFQPEPRPIVDQDGLVESASSLDDMTSLVSGSSETVRTVIERERSHTESDRMDGSATSEQLSLTVSATSEGLSMSDSREVEGSSTAVTRVENVATHSQTDVESNPNSMIVSSTSSTERDILNVSTQVTSKVTTRETAHSNGPTQVEYDAEYDAEHEVKKRGHRRNGSTSFKPSMIPVYSGKKEKRAQDIVEDSAESDKYKESLTTKEDAHEEKKDVDESEKLEEFYQTEADQGLQRDIREGRVYLQESFSIDSSSSKSRLPSSVFSEDRPDSELAELLKQSSSDIPCEDPIERPSTPEPSDECEIKDDTPEFSSEAQASVTELEMEYSGAFSRQKEYEPHVSPIKESGNVYAEKHELESYELTNKDDSDVYKLRASPVPDITITQHITHYQQDSIDKDEVVPEKPSPQTSASSKTSVETDQGKEYTLEEAHFVVTDIKDEHDSESPTSDSFEMLEKPDISDEFVIIEEVAKEADECDTEGKSRVIQTRMTSTRVRAVVEKPKTSPPPPPKTPQVKHYKDSDDDIPFDFDAHSSPAKSSDDRVEELSQEESPPFAEDPNFKSDLEAGKKWIEMQFQGEPVAQIYGYDIEFERGPLEDIKEEDINDLESSSKIGSMGSQVSHSIGSFGSVKESLSSTPDYDVLAGRKYFSRSGEHDDVSMSSLQEFERLENLIALESTKHRSAGSQGSLTNSSNSGKQGSKSGGDDISCASLKEFEGLEKACIAAETIEQKAKAEEELLLSEIEEGHESQASESESCHTVSAGVVRVESDEDDYERRMFEIDEIIKQAQTNVEQFMETKVKEGQETKCETLGRADSLEEISKVPELDLDQPLYPVYSSGKSYIQQWDLSEELLTSTDSLDVKTQVSKTIDPFTTSTDSLEVKASHDVMSLSTDSIEASQKLKKKDIMTDSIEGGEKTSMITSSDSLEGKVTQASSLDEDDHHGARGYDHSSSSSKEDAFGAVGTTNRMPPPRAEFLLGSTDSLEPTSSTATHATYHYENDSVMSSSFTSGDSATMMDDDVGTHEGIYFDDGKPYVTEVIEPVIDDENFSHVIHRTVEMPPQVQKISFKGEGAERALRDYMDKFDPGEDVSETREVDKDGNVHVKRVVQRRVIIKPEDVGDMSDLTGPELERYVKSLSSSQPPEFMTPTLESVHSFSETHSYEPATHYRTSTTLGQGEPETYKSEQEPKDISGPQHREDEENFRDLASGYTGAQPNKK